MQLSEFADLPIIDCHVHFGEFRQAQPSLTQESLEELGGFMVEVIEKGRISQMYITGREMGLYLKAKYPGLFYAGGFVPWSGRTDALANVHWPSYISSLIEAGYEGIGEMGSKPAPRDVHTPLDSDYYEAFWDACESAGYPVLCHVADPEEFWSEKLAPAWAKQRGWIYYLGDYLTKEELYSEMENVLDAHPRLRIVVAHFCFMSADIERAEDFLNRHENANFDLTLGIELMYNISRRRDYWRDFFIKYQDRIFFGTDIAPWQTLDEAVARIWLIRNFLESGEEFFTPSTADILLTRYGEPYIGLRLPRGVLRKIYAENFKRLWGERPKEIDLGKAIQTCQSRDGKVVAEALERLVPRS